MKKSIYLLFFLLLSTIAYSGFEIKSVNVGITMDDDGSGKVQEIVKFYVQGEEAQSQYIAGLSSNELSFWTKETQLSDLRVHLNSEVVDIENFRIIPQPLKNCNDATNECLGEIKMDYDIYPYYIVQSEDSKEIIEGTGLFSMDPYKPRTTRFSINENALFFETAEVEHITLINKYTTFTITVPVGSTVLEVNPVPDDLEDLIFPTTVNSYSWKNTLLVKFSFIYEIEKGLDQEILEFFSGLYGDFDSLIFGPEGLSTVLIILVLFVFYIALTSMSKRKR